MTKYFNSLEDKEKIYIKYLERVCCNKPMSSWVNPSSKFSVHVDKHNRKYLIVKTHHTIIKKLINDETFNDIMNI